MTFPHESDLTAEEAERIAGKISLLVNTNNINGYLELASELSPEEQLDCWQYLHSTDRTKAKAMLARGK